MKILSVRTKHSQEQKEQKEQKELVYQKEG